MSASQEQHDSDGSWTWVDNEEENFRQRVVRRRSSYERAEIEDVRDEQARESDVSVLTDPEDHPEAGAENVEQGTPLGCNDVEKARAHFTEMAAEMHKAAAVKAALDVARPGESELAVTERRARAYFRSTLTSAGFMIGGLLIAAYCQWGCDSNYSSPVQEYYDRPYDDGDVEFIQPLQKGRNTNYKQHDRKEQLKYSAHQHKNSKEKYADEKPGQRGGKRPFDELESPVKKQKKGDYRNKKDKNYRDYNSHEHRDRPQKKVKKHHDDDSHEDKEHFKHKPRKQEKHNRIDKHKIHHAENREHDDYLHKKDTYLKQKESKLKQKEFKLYAKGASSEHNGKQQKHKNVKHGKRNETSGEWYDNMHKARKNKRKQDEQADWVFERAAGRDRKRDKAHWYFYMMDERETNRVRKV